MFSPTKYIFFIILIRIATKQSRSPFNACTLLALGIVRSKRTPDAFCTRAASMPARTAGQKSGATRAHRLAYHSHTTESCERQRRIPHRLCGAAECSVDCTRHALHDAVNMVNHVRSRSCARDNMRTRPGYVCDSVYVVRSDISNSVIV